jgi:hypothetical protein
MSNEAHATGSVSILLQIGRCPECMRNTQFLLADAVECSRILNFLIGQCSRQLHCQMEDPPVAGFHFKARVCIPVRGLLAGICPHTPLVLTDITIVIIH